MSELIEYRIRKITRYAVTRFERKESGLAGSTIHGEFTNQETAYEVGYALARAEHERLGYPPGDERIIYPELCVSDSEL